MMFCEIDGKISIHAPARGATTGIDWHDSGRLYFNPRPREGGDRG